MTQMEQWSILSNILNYIQHNRHHIVNHTLNTKTVNKMAGINPRTQGRKENGRARFWEHTTQIMQKYLDVYKGIQSEIVNTMRLNENSDFSMTYLGKSDKRRNDKLKVKESFPISEHGYTSGKLLDGTECQLLLDTGTSKLFMSKSFYMQCKSPHSLPKFMSKTQRIQVGNGQCVSILFIIPVIIDVHGHRFEIYTLVSEIYENVDVVLKEGFSVYSSPVMLISRTLT